MLCGWVEGYETKNICFSYDNKTNHLNNVNLNIAKGDVIGFVGQSGRAPYPYLYYEVKKDNINLDPENLIFGGF